jgi:hypothetical protein
MQALPQSAGLNRGLALRPETAAVEDDFVNDRIFQVGESDEAFTLPTIPHALYKQGDVPCCVSCALTAAMECLSVAQPTLSPLFHYHVTRYDTAGADPQGALYLIDGLNTITNKGISILGLYDPVFTLEAVATDPDQEAYDDAQTRALGRRNLQLRYQSVGVSSRALWARQQLLANKPIVIGFRLPNTYPGNFLDGDFAWKDPAQFAMTDSGHCVLAYGFDDAKQCLRIQDCQGNATFDQGCWWFGYEVLDSAFVQDVYCLVP